MLALSQMVNPFPESTIIAESSTDDRFITLLSLLCLLEDWLVLNSENDIIFVRVYNV